MLDRQSVQDGEYTFPYHHLPWFEGGRLRLWRALGWGIVYLSYLRQVITFVGNEENTPLLDVGCGDGRLLLELHREFPSTELHGCDLSQRAVYLALAANPGLDIRCQGIDAYEDSILFRTVTLIETLEHLPPEEIPDLVDAIHRRLVPGGRLILTVPTLNTPVSEKHFQHFDADSLDAVIGKDLQREEIVYLDALDSRIYNAFQRTRLGAKLLIVPPIATWVYHYYQRHCAVCHAGNAERILAVYRAT